MPIYGTRSLDSSSIIFMKPASKIPAGGGGGRGAHMAGGGPDNSALLRCAGRMGGHVQGVVACSFRRHLLLQVPCYVSLQHLVRGTWWATAASKGKPQTCYNPNMTTM